MRITKGYKILPQGSLFLCKHVPIHTGVSFLEAMPNFHPLNFQKLECMISEQLIGNFLLIS